MFLINIFHNKTNVVFWFGEAHN